MKRSHFEFNAVSSQQVDQLIDEFRRSGLPEDDISNVSLLRFQNLSLEAVHIVMSTTMTEDRLKEFMLSLSGNDEMIGSLRVSEMVSSSSKPDLSKPESSKLSELDRTTGELLYDMMVKILASGKDHFDMDEPVNWIEGYDGAVEGMLHSALSILSQKGLMYAIVNLDKYEYKIRGRDCLDKLKETTKLDGMVRSLMYQITSEGLGARKYLVQEPTMERKAEIILELETKEGIESSVKLMVLDDWIPFATSDIQITKPTLKAWVDKLRIQKVGTGRYKCHPGDAKGILKPNFLNGLESKKK